ncbi:type IV pilus secretin PilQ [Aquifex pyrophilus]
MMRLLYILILIIFGFGASQEIPPLENINRIGKIEIYIDGYVYKYTIFEVIKGREKTVNAYVYTEDVKKIGKKYRNFTVLRADFQNLKLGTVIVSLAKILKKNVIFGTELWKSFQVSKNVSEDLQETSEYTLQITTTEDISIGSIQGKKSETSSPKKETKALRKNKRITESISLPSYLFRDISLVINSPISAVDLFNTILEEYNLMAVKERGNIIKISVKGNYEIDVSDLDENQIKKVLKKLEERVSPSARIVYDRDLKKIYITDLKENIEKLKDLKEELLKAEKRKKAEKELIRIFYFKNRRDLEVAQSLLKERFGEGVVTETDEDFNALIVFTNSEAVYKELENILKPLTKGVSETYITTKVFFVRYISPFELKKEIEPFLSEEGEVYVLKTGGSQKGGREAQGTGTDNVEITQGEFSISKTRKTYFEVRNAILIKDYPERIREIYNKFKKFLSEKPLRIRIKARFLEIRKDLKRELGLAGWNVLFSQASVPKFWQTETTFEPATESAGLLTFIFQKGKLNLLDLRLKAYERENKARIISEPYIVTLNGEPAVINTQVEWPIPKVTISQNTADITVEYREIPLTLIATPVVLPNNQILLDIGLLRGRIVEIRRFQSVNITQDIPVIESSRIDVKIPVNNGDTVVIGGIVEREKRETERGIPGLRKVPLLGWLFKDQIKENADRELLIFLTPELVESE